MTDREKAIVMAYTGVTMLTGDKLGIFYKYIEELLGHPVMIHELANQDIQDEITRKSKEDFVALCKDNNTIKYGTNDLISRKAAIEALQNHYEVRNAQQNAIMDECVMIVHKLPIVPAVPLDKLCECLVQKHIGFVDEVDGKRLTATLDKALWATLIKEWMGELDATN